MGTVFRPSQQLRLYHSKAADHMENKHCFPELSPSSLYWWHVLTVSPDHLLKCEGAGLLLQTKKMCTSVALNLWPAGPYFIRRGKLGCLAYICYQMIWRVSNITNHVFSCHVESWPLHTFKMSACTYCDISRKCSSY